MGEGWEARRLRGPGHDSVVVRLGVAGRPRLVEVDTTCFVHNASAEVALWGSADGATWEPLLPRTRLQPDTRHRFRIDAPVVTHVRLDAHPDGGLARLRVHGEVDAATLAELTRAVVRAAASGGRGGPTLMDLVVVGDRVVLPTGTGPAAVGVHDGRIVSVTTDVPVARHTVRLADDEVLLPGLVDSHVHLQDPGRTDWEDAAGATAAAALGGVTTLVDMPLDADPVTVDLPSLAAKRAALTGRLQVDVGLWGGAVPSRLGRLGELLDGRGARLQVLPVAERARRLPAARRGRSGARADGAARLRCPAARARRGRDAPAAAHRAALRRPAGQPPGAGGGGGGRHGAARGRDDRWPRPRRARVDRRRRRAAAGREGAGPAGQRGDLPALPRRPLGRRALRRAAAGPRWLAHRGAVGGAGRRHAGPRGVRPLALRAGWQGHRRPRVDRARGGLARAPPAGAVDRRPRPRSLPRRPGALDLPRTGRPRRAAGEGPHRGRRRRRPVRARPGPGAAADQPTAAVPVRRAAAGRDRARDLAARRAGGSGARATVTSTQHRGPGADTTAA